MNADDSLSSQSLDSEASDTDNDFKSSKSASNESCVIQRINSKNKQVIRFWIVEDKFNKKQDEQSKNKFK